MNRNWVILDYEEPNGLTVRPWAPFLSNVDRALFTGHGNTFKSIVSSAVNTWSTSNHWPSNTFSCTRQIPKTWPLHPSSQTHVSKPYRRFIHKEFGHVSSKPCLLREYVQACQVPGWLTRTLQEDSLNRQRVFNRIKLQSYAVSFGCILMSQLPFVRTWRCVQRISISFLFSWFPRLIVVPLSSHEVDGVRKEKERLTAVSSCILLLFSSLKN